MDYSTIDQLIESYKDDILNTTAKALSYESVKDIKSSAPGQPFGPGIGGALEYMLDEGERLGFVTDNLDGYAGHIQAGTDGPLVAVLAHLDVVPAGSGWTLPPFAGTLKDGAMYGRGVQDNKGPAVTSLYAMKAAHESGLLDGVRVRVILGTDEESDWECMDRYFRTEEKPAMAFTPDAAFPVIAGEKGLMAIRIDFSGAVGQFIAAGGSAVNMVPDQCTATFANLPSDVAESLRESLVDWDFGAASPPNITLVSSSQGSVDVTITMRGMAAHGSTPGEGVNAIVTLARFISDLTAEGHLGTLQLGRYGQIMDWIHKYVGFNWDGSGLGIASSHPDMGALTVNLGLLKDSYITLDIRTPMGTNTDDVIEKIKSSLPPGAALTVMAKKDPIYSEPSSPLVVSLMKAWDDVTREPADPVYMGGTTYAKAIPNCVAFGAAFPGAPEMAHQADELWSVDDIMKATRIFARAIALMAKAAKEQAQGRGAVSS